jgi:hypothetical protein
MVLRVGHPVSPGRGLSGAQSVTGSGSRASDEQSRSLGYRVGPGLVKNRNDPAYLEERRRKNGVSRDLTPLVPLQSPGGGGGEGDGLAMTTAALLIVNSEAFISFLKEKQSAARSRTYSMLSQGPCDRDHR